jgi:signal peptidase II
MTRRISSKAVACVGFVVVVALDQITKTLVLRNIGAKERIDVMGPLSLVKRYNTGVAFSIGNGSAVTAWLVTVVVAALLVWVVRTISRGTQPLFAFLLAVIAGGGVGNQLDRLFRGAGWNKGAVIDFIDSGVLNFAIFNIADMALSVGCAILAVWTLFGRGPDHPMQRLQASVQSVLSEGLRSHASPEDARSASNDKAFPDGSPLDRGPSNVEGSASSAPSSLGSLDNNDFSTKGR